MKQMKIKEFTGRYLTASIFVKGEIGEAILRVRIYRQNGDVVSGEDYSYEELQDVTRLTTRCLDFMDDYCEDNDLRQVIIA